MAQVTELIECMAAADCAIRARGLVKRFGGHAALDGLDLDVPDGSFYLLIGPNGAGKTTAFRCLLGMLQLDGGELSFPTTGHSPDRVRAVAGYVPEDTRMSYSWLRITDLISHHASYYSAWDEEYARRLINLLEIPPRSRYGGLSKGQSRRVQLLLALAHRPRFLFLDEPTDGLDRMARDMVQAVLAEHMVETNCTLIVSTHLVYEMDRLADHVAILKRGRLAVQLPREDLHARLLNYTIDADRIDMLDSVNLIHARRASMDQWVCTIWGGETSVVSRLSASGVSVIAVTPLSLDDAALTLLHDKTEGRS